MLSNHPSDALKSSFRNHPPAISGHRRSLPGVLKPSAGVLLHVFQVVLHHQRDLEGDGIIKGADIKAG